MKYKYLFVASVIFILCVSAVNNKKVIGVWEIAEFTFSQKGVQHKSDEKTLRDAGSVWNMYFSEDGNFKQEFNMKPPEMKMETENGTWKLEADSLFIEIKADNFTRKLNYSFISLGDAFVITLQNPVTPDKVVAKFRRK